MLREKTPLITETTLYAGFRPFTRILFKYWKDRIIEIGDGQATLATIKDIDHRLLSRNAMVFFDHHYAFDAIPTSLALGKSLQHVTGALIPYAIHLDMGVNQQGLPSLRYRIRTLAFQRLIRNIKKTNPHIVFLPVVREFEMNTPGLREIVERDYSGVNTRYLKTLSSFFTQQRAGQVCVLSPMAGIAFPEKPALHTQVYRSMEIVQRRYKQPLPFYFLGAYPTLQAHYHYVAPLLTKHTIVARGPFNLPIGDYEQAREVVADHLYQLRQAAQFTPPDYDRFSRK